MEDKKKNPVAKALTDDQLEQVSGGQDALPAEQLDHTEKNVEIIVDHTVLPDVVTDVHQ